MTLTPTKSTDRKPITMRWHEFADHARIEGWKDKTIAVLIADGKLPANPISIGEFLVTITGW